MFVKMSTQCYFSFLLLSQYFLLIVNGASAAAHNHFVDNLERESDGSFRSRDSDHYSEAGHNADFDHEAILGTVKEAEEYDRLSPEDAKKRLALLLPKMDLNGDYNIDRSELKQWILKSFVSLAHEEAEERLTEADDNKDGIVTWSEYLQDSFGVDSENEVTAEHSENGMVGLLQEEKEMWAVADKNGDNALDRAEFEIFSNPEEHAEMHPYIVKQTIREKDKNNDGLVDFTEFLGERGAQQDKSWLVAERDRFEYELDINKDGQLDEEEIRAWVIPDNNEIAEEEVDHLFASADDDHNNLLSYDEIIKHHDVFVGSEATDYGNDLMEEHYNDEL